MAELAAPVRLAVVAQFPVHYHLPLYRAMAADVEIDADVLYMQEAWSSSGFDPEVNAVVDWGSDDKFAGYSNIVFSNISPIRDGTGFWKFVNPRLIWRVLSGPYDVVYIHGHNHFTHVACAIASRVARKRLVLRTILNDRGGRSAKVRFVRRLLYGSLYRLADVLPYIGTDNNDALRGLGVQPEKLVYMPHVVDNDFFEKEKARLAGRESDLKRAFGIREDQRVVLFCAKFRPVKQPLLMIEAFVEAGLGDGWVLLMLGEGEQRSRAEALAREHADVRIVFAGWLEPARVAEAYAVADIVVLPSKNETWGLVVNEAMNFGCALIVSDQVSAGVDLVADTSGIVFPHRDRSALVDALRKLAADDALRSDLGARGLAKIRDWSVASYMAGLHRALGIGERSA